MHLVAGLHPTPNGEVTVLQRSPDSLAGLKGVGKERGEGVGKDRGKEGEKGGTGKGKNLEGKGEEPQMSEVRWRQCVSADVA